MYRYLQIKEKNAYAEIDPGALRRLRLAKGLSLDELAARAKIDKQTIHRIEKGSSGNTRDRTFNQLTRALNADPAVLTGAKSPDTDDEDQSYFLMSKLGFRISTSTHNAMYLVCKRYNVKYQDIVELAPFLFCWAAEASLRRRRDKLKQVELAYADARELQSGILHLNPSDLTEPTEAIAAERESIENKDLFGLSGDYYFKPEDWRENPFADFLFGLTKAMGEDATFEGYSCFEYPHYRVCAKEAERFADGNTELAEHILEGHVALIDLPKELREIGKREERAQWVRGKVEEFKAEMLRQL